MNLMDEQKEAKKRIYCAIYTRKSTSEGLDQDFTSLDAQREAAENYIKSQKHEGWVALQERYDDGGFTGANLERPALQKLLNDINDHKIDCVVVYKVDRLSRSLTDFVRVLELFDKTNVTFVSVTQQFNTNTSMGRLTLNILLSFAQFEREIISERTKDKIGAARKRGKWLGGRPPFGYNWDKENKRILVNSKEAEVVREMFALYLKGNSLLQVGNILSDKGLRSRPGVCKNGRPYGGKRYGVTQVQKIITNVLYIGKVRYEGQIYNGQQEAIIDEETFNQVQEKLKQNRTERRATKNTECTGLLTHLLHCKICQTFMVHTYTLKKSSHKYRYYVCTNAHKRGYHSCPTKSINAQAIEDAVLESLKRVFADNKPNEQTTESAAILSPAWETLFPEEKRRILRTIIKEISYDSTGRKLGILLNNSDVRLEFDADIKKVRALNKLHKDTEIEKEPAIRRNLLLAYQMGELMLKEKVRPKQAAKWLNMREIRINQMLNFLLLAPAIQEEIMFSEDSRVTLMPEYKLRTLFKEFDWQKQSQLWQDLLQKQS